MKVKELVEQLNKVDQNIDVVIGDVTHAFYATIRKVQKCRSLDEKNTTYIMLTGYIK
jgi:hypothetical protein